MRVQEFFKKTTTKIKINLKNFNKFNKTYDFVKLNHVDNFIDFKYSETSKTYNQIEAWDHIAPALK